MLTGRFPDPVAIRLPRGGSAAFPLALAELSSIGARAGVVKDAGDDPDITHGALIIAETAWTAPGSGIGFAAGEGVGTVTRAGLSLAIGEPAINPAPRALIRDGSGYWRYVPIEDGVRFITQYDYDTRWGEAGRARCLAAEKSQLPRERVIYKRLAWSHPLASKSRSRP